ncbi:MAG: peptide chain release factor N(5)-glutamine methyltransferase [Pararhodobacter sp.]
MSTGLRGLLAAAAARLRAAGVPDPVRDARLLAAHALGLAPDRLTLHLDDQPDPAQRARLEQALLARAARQPVSQIIGGRWFWGRWFRVTPEVLDPRPETETLVAAALEEPFHRVLDLGTGSGAILLSLLAEQPAAEGYGIDISVPALGVAAQNAATLGLEGRVRLHRSDWFSDVAGRFDLIVANPPYIGADEMPGLAPESRDWEPHLALTPGGDGLDAYRRIATGVVTHLASGGRLFLEIGPTQAAAVSALLVGVGLKDVRTLHDLDGRARVVSARASRGPDT